MYVDNAEAFSTHVGHSRGEGDDGDMLLTSTSTRDRYMHTRIIDVVSGEPTLSCWLRLFFLFFFFPPPSFTRCRGHTWPCLANLWRICMYVCIAALQAFPLAG